MQNALDRDLPKDTRQNADRYRQSPDPHCPIPTDHLHAEGRQAEDQRERDRVWKLKAIRNYSHWIPYLNTRVDLTLKTGIDLLAPGTPAAEAPPQPKGTGIDRSLQASTNLIDASGALIASISAATDVRQKSPSRPLQKDLQSHWIRVTEDLIARDVVRFMLRLNRYVVRPPRKAEYKPRLNALVVLEYGRTRYRPHLHALIERPMSVDAVDFAEAVRQAWLAQPSAYREMSIQPVHDRDACLAYGRTTLSKEKGRYAWPRTPSVYHRRCGNS